MPVLSRRRSRKLCLEAPKAHPLKGEDDEKDGNAFDAPGIRPAEANVPRAIPGRHRQAVCRYVAAGVKPAAPR